MASLADGPLPAKEMFKEETWEAKLAVAPGTVYGNRWEQRWTNAEALAVPPVPGYAPPLGPPLASNPRVWLHFRAGGAPVGRVLLELRADAAPVTAHNFSQLARFGVYKGAIAHRAFADFCLQGGDYTRRCSVVCPPGGSDCFDLGLVPASEGGRSIYGDRPDGLFDDEATGLRHAPGTLSMSNPGRADANGSQARGRGAGERDTPRSLPPRPPCRDESGPLSRLPLSLYFSLPTLTRSPHPAVVHRHLAAGRRRCGGLPSVRSRVGGGWEGGAAVRRWSRPG